MKPPPEEQLADVRRHILERVKIGAQAYMSLALLDDLKCNTMWDYMGEHLRVAITGYVFSGKKHRQTLKWERVPATWWDHFKDRWFPDWLCRRFPVNMKSIPMEVAVTHVCPHLNIKCGDASHLSWLEQTPELDQFIKEANEKT